MGEGRPFHPVKLVVGVLSTHPEYHTTLFSRLEERFGAIELVTDPVPFGFTDYYDQEMGGNPQRFFIVFHALVDPTELVGCKLYTNGLEQEFAIDGKRTLNLDPGILSAGNLILATTKNRSHRIPLGMGIYGEVTLLYAKKAFQSFPWTYADYKSDAFRELFSNLRGTYLAQLKAEISHTEN